jgi:Short C-terminal domain
MPGLLRGMARTAVVAGTATAVSNRVGRRQANRWAAQEPAYQEPYPQQAPAPAAPAAGGEGRVEKLKDLAALKEHGVLTDEEFAAEKSRILAS